MPKAAEATDPERLGQLIRRHRKQLGLRQVDLAEIIGEDQRYITAVETGKITPPIYRLRPFIHALDIPTDEVFETAEAQNGNGGNGDTAPYRARLVRPPLRLAA